MEFNMLYRCLDIKMNLLDKPDVFKYEFTTWNAVISFLRKSINSCNHFVYVSKVMKDFTSVFHVLHRTSQSFHNCVSCYESLNNDLEALWINSKSGDCND